MLWGIGDFGKDTPQTYLDLNLEHSLSTNKISMEQFTTEIKDVEVSGLGGYLNLGKEDSLSLDTNTSQANMDYELEFEMRSWGLKSIYIHIKEIRLSVFWSTESNQDEKEIEINSNDREWEVEHELTFQEDGMMSPNDIEVDFSNMLITVK